MAENRSIINVAVIGPYHNLFSYRVHPNDGQNLEPGCRFLVPFGPGTKIAFHVNYQSEPVAYRLRYVKERIDAVSPFPPYLFDFCSWIADYYFAGLGETLAAALPGTGTKKPPLEFVALDRTALETIDGVDQAIRDLARRLLQGRAVAETSIMRDSRLLPVIRRWLETGVVATRYRGKTERKRILGYRITEAAVPSDMKGAEKLAALHRDTIYSRKDLLDEYGLTAYQLDKLTRQAVVEKVMDETGVTELTHFPIRHDLPRMELLEAQQKALEAILPALRDHRFEPFLLYGVTGSGKTMVYCHAARAAVDDGGAVLMMVPEIPLAGQLLASFAAFFGDRVAVIHSGLTNHQRLVIRERIAAGEIRVVIGPRSAIFAPLKNLRLIIVDEEHDSSYKQDDPAPRYHGRDAAVMLARMVGCPIILGSASPSIESYHNAATGRYRLLTLDQRPKSGYRMPRIVILDMKTEKISGECSFLAFRLKQETERHIADGGQVIYYLNRRGFSPRLKCRECGQVPTCPDCGVTLTYHRIGHQLKCHFCDRVEPAPEQCPHCHAADFIYVGTGTQRVEENLSRLFADIRAERIDSDQTARKSGRLILSDFAAEKFDLLVGTQMVTKGLDIPGVTLVGVLSADIGLDMPDFRAAEKSYARLLQVAGRAGRGDREGLVMIQSYYSDHPVIGHLIDGDYRCFFEAVLAERRELHYPPFSRLINITLLSPDEKLLEKEAPAFRIRLEGHLAGLTVSGAEGAADDARPVSFILLGPSPAPMYKLRGQFRRRLILKCGAIKRVLARLRRWEAVDKSFGLPAKVRVIIDVDPMNMM